MVLLIVVVLVILVISAFIFSQKQNPFRAEYKKLLQELDQITKTHSDSKQAELHRIVSRWDNFIARLLFHYGYKDESVNQRIRRAMEAKFFEYEEFKVVKAFHFLRNQVVHEDKRIYTSDEQLIWAMTSIISRKI